MTEILTESYCERCGAKFTFESTSGRGGPFARARTMALGLRNYLTSEESLDEALAEARRDRERRASTVQLAAFHDTFSFCFSCRQYTCRDCWNEAAGKCRTCAPLEGVPDPLDRLANIRMEAPAPDEGLVPGIAAASQALEPTASTQALGADATGLLDRLETDRAALLAATSGPAPAGADAGSGREAAHAFGHTGGLAPRIGEFDMYAWPTAEFAAGDGAALAPAATPFADDTTTTEAILPEPEAEPEAVAAEPVVAEVEPLVAAPEPEAEPEAVAAEPLVAAPEPEAEAEAIVAEPEPVAEVAEIEPEGPEAPEAEPLVAAPEPEAEAEAEAIVAEPLVAAPEAAAEPEVAEVELEAEAAVEPVVAATEPEAAVAEPEAEPEAIVAEPLVAAPETEPEVQAAGEAALEPVVAATEPEAVVAEPEVAEVEPLVAALEPEAEAIVAEPEAVAAEAEVAKAELAVEAAVEPVVVATEPQAVVAEPEVAVVEPLVAVPEPEVEAAGEAALRPTVAAAEPEAEVQLEPHAAAPAPEAAAVEPVPGPALTEVAPPATPAPPAPSALDRRPILARPTAIPEPPAPAPWQIVAPEEPMPAPTQEPRPAPGARDSTGPVSPIGWLVRRRELATPEVSARITRSVWEESSREVISRPGSGIQPCQQCGLPLSASARFCRRCGSRQA